MEVLPIIISPTLKFSTDATLRVTTFESQLSTIPVAEFEVTVSPTLKLFVVNLVSKVGKCFLARIFPEEFEESNIPGISPSVMNSDMLNVTLPIPPRFSVVPVRVYNL